MNKRIVTGVGLVLVVAAMLGTALFVSSLLKTKANSCPEMAAAASTGAAQGARHIQIVIGLAGNTDAVAAEAEKFVQAALGGQGPAARIVATVTLVDGAKNYQPTGNPAACVGEPLVVSGSEADLQSYKDASSDAKPDVAKALLEQYSRQVNLIAAAVAASTRSAPAPEAGADTGAFGLWPFVARAPSTDEVVVLAPFTVGGNNCLTILGNPASLASTGSTTAISERVNECVTAGQVMMASATQVHLTPVGSLTLTGTQQEAQQAVIAALCDHATPRGCRGNT